MAAATTGGAFNGQGGTYRYDKRPLAQFQQGGATPGGAYPVRGTSAGNRDGCTLQDTSFQAGSQRAFATTCSALYDDATSERSALQSAAAFMPSSVQKPSERKLGLPSCLDRTGACGRTGRGGGEGGGGSLPAGRERRRREPARGGGRSETIGETQASGARGSYPPATGGANWLEEEEKQEAEARRKEEEEDEEERLCLTPPPHRSDDALDAPATEGKNK